MEKSKEFAPIIRESEHRRLLAITRMHGARRRIESKLRQSCKDIPCHITTIDGFALEILNKWRKSISFETPIHPVQADKDFETTLFGIEAHFDKIIEKATELVSSPTVGKIIRDSFPVVLIDEFQDCHGVRLKLVEALSNWSEIIVAADDFQLLDSNIEGCPAVEWISSLDRNESVEHEELNTCHRTSDSSILDAAKCLREDIISNEVTVPVYYHKAEGPLAFKMIDSLIFGWYTTRWTGTTAMICPSHDPIIDKVIKSGNGQLKKKGRQPIRWYFEPEFNTYKPVIS